MGSCFCKSLRSACAFIALLLLLSGCGRPAAPLRLMIWSQEPEHKTLENRLEEFSRQNPKIRVELVVCSSREECRAKLIADSRRGAPADVCLVNGSDVPDLVHSRLIRNLQPHHPDLRPILPETSKAMSDNGALYAMPRDWSALVLYYNRTMFERQGLPLPRAAWDWGDLLHAARVLTIKDEDNAKTVQYGLEIRPTIEMWAPFIWQNRGQLMGKDHAWTLTHPQFFQSNQQAIEFYADLVRQHHVIPPLAELNAVAAKGGFFALQKAAMTFAHREFGSRLASLENKSKFDWDIVPLPHGRESASWLEVEGYAMTAKSKRPLDSWKLISFLTGETSQAAMILDGTRAPSWRSLMTSKIFTDFPGPSAIHNSALMESLPSAVPPPPVPYWDKASLILTEEMTSLMSDDRMSIRSAVERMQARLEELKVLSETRPRK